MTTPYDTIKSAILGNPIDPNKKPSRTGVVKAFQELQVQTDGAQSGSLIFGTKAQMTATVVVPSANIMAWVAGDPVTANNGIYRNTGTAGAAVWTRITDIPEYIITGLNVGAGTVNAIQITTDLPVPTADGRAMIIIPILGNNTISPPTVSINGASPIDIVSNVGENILIDGLVGGMYVAGFVADGKFRCISDQNNSAVLAQAEILVGLAATAVQPGLALVQAIEQAIADGHITTTFPSSPGKLWINDLDGTGAGTLCVS